MRGLRRCRKTRDHSAAPAAAGGGCAERQRAGNDFSARFERQAARAEWHASEESGTRNVEAPVFYVPWAETPELDGWLVQAALRNGGKLALLPTGESAR